MTVEELDFFGQLYFDIVNTKTVIEHMAAEIGSNKKLLTDDTTLELMSKLNDLSMQLIRLQVDITHAYLDHIKNS